MKNIPVYVYIVFLWLVYLGYKRCFTRAVRIERLWIMPAVFLFLSLRSMFSLFQVTTIYVIFWILGAGFGMLIGYFHVSKRVITANRRQKLISIPGDWTMLLLILLIFAFEFFMHYSIEAGLKFTKLPAFVFSSMLILGIIAGMPVGRNLTYMYKYTKAIDS